MGILRAKKCFISLTFKNIQEKNIKKNVWETIIGEQEYKYYKPLMNHEILEKIEEDIPRFI